MGRRPTIKPLVKCGGCEKMVRVVQGTALARGQYWCSQECKRAITRPIVSCPQCGKEHRRRTDASRKNGTFCSQQCWYQHKKRDGEHRDCMTCGKPVWKAKGQLHRKKWFCSLECSVTHEHRKKFGTDKPTCVVCGNEHDRVDGTRGYRKTCSKECTTQRRHASQWFFGFEEWADVIRHEHDRVSKKVSRLIRYEWLRRCHSALESLRDRAAGDLSRDESQRMEYSESNWTGAAVLGLSRCTWKAQDLRKRAENEWWWKCKSIVKNLNHRSLVQHGEEIAINARQRDGERPVATDSVTGV